MSHASIVPRALAGTSPQKRLFWFVLTFACAELVPGQVDADVFTWRQGDGGIFGDAENWTGGTGLPTEGHVAFFSLGSEYVVTFRLGRRSGETFLDNDQVTFDLNGHTYGTFLLRVGLSAGPGFLTLDRGDVLVRNLAMGIGAGSQGTLTLTGGTTFDAFERLEIGLDGVGTLEIKEGGIVTSPGATLGSNGDSNGTVTVEGASLNRRQSAWNDSGILTVGGSGRGALRISDAGVVTSRATILGDLPGSNGFASVREAPSAWSMEHVWVGDEGNATLIVSGGGRVTSESLLEDDRVGNQVGSVGSVLVNGVSAAGNPSTWTSTGKLIVAVSGGGSFSVLAGARAEHASVEIGGAGGTGQFLVRGADELGNPSTWIVTEAIVGDERRGSGVLTVAGGGLAITGAATVAEEPGSTGDVIVDGTGPAGPSRWISGNARRLSVGAGGTGSLTIAAGGVAAHPGMSLGELQGSSGTVLVVGQDESGSPSTLSVTGLEIGRQGTGAVTIAEGGALVTDGEAIQATIFIGEQIGSDGTLTVDGVGSSWTSSIPAYVGGTESQAGGNGSLQVTDGASVNVAGELVVWNAGTVEVSEATVRVETIDLSQAALGALQLQGSELAVDAVVGDLTLADSTLARRTSPGRLAVEGGYTQGATATLRLQFAATKPGEFDQLSVSGAAALAGTLEVRLANSFEPRAGDHFVVVEAQGGLNGTFNAILLPELEEGLRWEVEEGSTTIALIVAGGGAFQRPGDCNQDSQLDLSDAVCTLGHLFQGAPAKLPCGDGSADDPGNRALLDSNADGDLDLSDAIFALLFLFHGGEPPALGIECVEISGCPNACAE